MGRFEVVAVWILVLLCRTHFSEQLNTEADFLGSFLQATGREAGYYNFSAPVCVWNGVICDRKRRIVELTVRGGGLRGPIPENSIGKLKSLELLDLDDNSLTELPSDIWGLSNLRYLVLSNNNLSGPLPNNIVNFGALTKLDLSYNRLSGLIPESLASLPTLQFLSLSHNLFNGTVPRNIFSHKSLVQFDLSSNQLTGSIGGSGGLTQFLPQLRILNLADNQLEGQIHDFEFSQVSRITFLNISNNLFTGPLHSLPNLTTLEIVDLSNNSFSGSIDFKLWSCPSLSVVKLGMNKLSGKLELPLVGGSPLREVDVNNNMFEGQMPQILDNFFGLRYLDLSANGFSGKMRGDLSRLSSLEHLNLAGNSFSLSSFPNITFLGQLEYLNLSACQLTGSIPAEMVKLEKLKVMDVSRNHLNGHIPRLPVALDYVDFSVNNLTGNIPMELEMRFEFMVYFNFSHNNLTLCLSSDITHRFPGAFREASQSQSCPIAVNPHSVEGKPRNGRSRFGLALGIALGCLLVGLLAVAVTCRKQAKWVVRQKLLRKEEKQYMSGPFSFETDSFKWIADVKFAGSVPVVMFEKPLLNITFADLLNATCHFNRETLMAEGRYGPVYRAVLPGGLHAAVKVLVNERVVNEEEAASEFEFLGNIKHPNLVPLVGYCLAGDQRIAIYDFMENDSLHHWLHDLPLGTQATEDWSSDTWEQNEGEMSMGWRARHRIALGTARALAFLHHGCSPPIVHQDVKASNIYLDAALEPHLADFGLANITCVSDSILLAGSEGYAPPEYGQTWTATSKGDVYSFGVVLYELITGKRPVSHYYPDSREVTLVKWVRYLIKTNRAICAIDPMLASTGSIDKMQEALRIGYLCTADCPAKRPTMQQIVGLLKDIDTSVESGPIVTAHDHVKNDPLR